MGTRIIEETIIKPKALVEIGDIPIICHVMNIYSHFGFNDFIICLGHKGFDIKNYFLNYYYHNHDFTLRLENKQSYTYNEDLSILDKVEIPWNITFVDTGNATETGGRLKRIKKYINSLFMMTYCDGLTDVNIAELVKFFKEKKKLASVLAVNSFSKFGEISIDETKQVTSFKEKIKDENFINGGFFVLDPEVFDYIEGDNSSWEYDCLPKIVEKNQLAAYKYKGFWKCMDSLKDKDELCKMWNENRAPWKIW